MDYDTILTELGEFGWWQRANTLLLWLPALAAGANVMVASFSVMQPPKYRCKMTHCDNDNFTFGDFEESEIFPVVGDTNSSEDGPTYNYCKFYEPKLVEGVCSFNKDNVIDCAPDAEFTFAPFNMDSSVATENNMYCSQYIWTPTIDSFFMIGLLAGSFIFGVLSDKIGRRHTLLLATLTCALGNLAGAFVSNKWGYAALRVLGGAGGEGAFVLAFTMSLEYSGVAERVPGLPWVTYSTLLANMISIPFAMGEMLPTVIGYFVRDWSMFQLAVSIFMLVTCLSWFLLPESPRYLISQGKVSQVTKVLEKAAKRNGVSLSPEVMAAKKDFEGEAKKEEEELEVYGLTDMFRGSQLKITIAFFITWPVITLLYYGLTLSADNIEISPNLYISYVAVAAIEVPAYIALPLIIDVWGRKPLFVCCQLFPGIFCIIAAFLTPGTAIYAILALSAKLGAAMAFNVTFMFTAQLYPTSIRNSAVGMCSTVARLGGLMAPWIGRYLTNPVVFEDPLPELLPLCLFGGFGVLGGLCALLLPEPLGFPLPNTFEDIEQIKKGGKSIWKCGAESKTFSKS